MRIVSLLPSATELVAAIGAADQLVGRSHECDHPDRLAHLPTLTAQKTSFDPATPAPSASIDAQVTAARAQGEPLYTLDSGLLAELSPDLVLTQDLCDVCSIDLASVRAVCANLDPEPEILSLNPQTVEDVLDDLLRVGRAVGRQAQAEAAMVALRGRLFRALEHTNQFAEPETVAFLEWTDPLFCAGHWTVQLLERAGARHPWNPAIPRPNAGAAVGPMHAERVAGPSRRITPQALIAEAPRALIVAPCGLDLSQTRAQTDALARHDWFNDLPAVRNNRVALVDGSQMFNRPGPRIADALEWLVGYLHDRPELIPDGFPWEPWR